jgi:hypothetical protein
MMRVDTNTSTPYNPYSDKTQDTRTQTLTVPESEVHRFYQSIDNIPF